MNVATILIDGTEAKLLERIASITAGMVGATVTFVYSDVWGSYTKTAVFRYQSLERSVVGIGEIVTIPPEMLSESGEKLQVGLYGVSSDGQEATPTIWVGLGRVQPGATGGNDSGSNPALPIWAQLLAMIGQLGELETSATNSLVAAINELSRHSTGGLPTFGEADEGKLLFVNNGAARSVDLGAGLEIVEIDGRPTMRLTVTPGGTDPEEITVTVTMGEDGTILVDPIELVLDSTGTITASAPVTLGVDGTIIIGGDNNG